MNNLKIFLAVVMFNCFILNVLAQNVELVRYIYNASKNRCLRTTGLPDTPLTYGICDNSDKTKWIINTVYFSGSDVQYRSKANPDYCVGVEDGIVSLKECNDDTTLYLSGNSFMINSTDVNSCLGLSESKPNQISLKNCDLSPDQIWYFIEWDITYDINVYFYNVERNKCIRTTGVPDSPLTFGACDNSESTVWIIPDTHEGYYRSKANPEYCLTIVDGVVALRECTDDSVLYRDVNFIKSPLSENYCISSSESNPDEVSVKECDAADQDQIWFYNSWDPSAVVVEEPPVVQQPEDVTVYFYNALRNKCLRTDGLPGSPLTYGSCDNSENTAWIIPATHEGNYRSQVNPDYCLTIVDGVVSLGECNENTTLYRDVNFIKSPLSENYCIGSSESDPDQISVKECNVDDQDQIWYFNNYDPSAVVIEEPPVVQQPEDVTVYFYNALRNKCLRTDGLPGSPLTYGSCDNSENTAWIIPATHEGNYRSQVNPDYCLTIVDGVVSLGECNENTTLYRDVNFIKSPLSENYCIGSSESDPDQISVKECNVDDQDQIWYFNNYDPSAVVIEEPPVVQQPETATIFFYSAFRNVCLNNDGTSVFSGSCDFTNNDSLWEIPVTHNGNYVSKTNPEKCLTIVDGVVSLGECNENNTLYRDGNFIRSPSSDKHCIILSKFDDSLEYTEECDASDFDHIWYFNIWTAPETEVATSTEVVVPTTAAEENQTEVVVPTTAAEENQTEVVVPTTAAEENPTMTITTTVTAIMTEAYN